MIFQKKSPTSLLESLAVCHATYCKLVKYFMMKTAFIDYLDNLNLTNPLKVPLLLNQTTHEQN